MAAENDTNTLKFKIEDQEYEIPALDELDMDEWQIIYDYSGLLLDDFAPADDKAVEDDDEDGPDEQARLRRVSQPGFTRAMLHIGYRRANPKLRPEQIKAVTGSAKLLNVLEAMGDQQADDAGPPELTPKPDASSPSTKGASNGAESPTSTKSSDAPASPAGTIGTSG